MVKSIDRDRMVVAITVALLIGMLIGMMTAWIAKDEYKKNCTEHYEHCRELYEECRRANLDVWQPLPDFNVTIKLPKDAIYSIE